jgi:hypothetical protein
MAFFYEDNPEIEGRPHLLTLPPASAEGFQSEKSPALAEFRAKARWSMAVHRWLKPTAI